MEKREQKPIQLSQLMDDELAAGELPSLLSELERRPELKRQWEQHHRLRQLLFEGGEQEDLASESFSQRVSDALRQQPVVVVEKRENRGRERWWGRYGWPAALAASLVGVIVFTQQFSEYSGSTAVDHPPGLQTEWVEVDGHWVERWVQLDEPPVRMRSYLVRHDEHRELARAQAVSLAPGGTVSSEGLDESPTVARRIVGWEPTWLPTGFRQVETLKHHIPPAGGVVHHLVISDGERVFSIFVEQGGRRDGEVVERQMAGQKETVNLHTLHRMGHRITVLGEVPMALVRRVAEAVEARSG